jgi:hypothetical protein
MTMETDKEGVSSIRIKLRQVISIAGAVASIISVFVFIGGFITGERYLSSELNSLREDGHRFAETIADLRTSNKAMEEQINSLDRQIVSMSGDVKYISQGVAELRLSNVPKH